MSEEKSTTRPNLSPQYGHVIMVSGIACCDSCQLTIAWMTKIKDVAIVMLLLSYFFSMT